MRSYRDAENTCEYAANALGQYKFSEKIADSKTQRELALQRQCYHACVW
jgi:hypothetical protein